MVLKGSVAIEGISLTIAAFDGESDHDSDPSFDILADQPAHAQRGRSVEY
jgi:hypothetical protein